MSGSFDAEDLPERSPGMSSDRTPVTSQRTLLGRIITTPPTLHPDTFLPDPNDLQSPSQSPQRTPSEGGNAYDALEPPAWEAPGSDEVAYTDAWNVQHSYSDRQHFLHGPGGSAPDDSTVGSSVTGGSHANNLAAPNFLRPRGFSLCSYPDAQSVGSAPAPQKGRAGHRRHPSLPVSFFSSKPQGGSGVCLSEQGNQMHAHHGHKRNVSWLQSTSRNTYEVNSHHNASQIRADAAMAGCLEGALLDLYLVDRTVDSAAARMMAVSEDYGAAGNEGARETEGAKPQKPRKTSLGTLNDIQCILELHRTDKLVDRFKRDLQMPEFFEEEAGASDAWKDLRRTDVEMEEHARRIRAKECREREKENPDKRMEEVQCQFDLSDDEDVGWNGQPDLPAAESCLTGHDAYQFFDPHETAALQANAYQSSAVAASNDDDLRDVINLLRTDVEVDGASRRRDEMELIQPLLAIDREMNRWKEKSEAKDMWEGDVRALYLVDLEVDGAKRRQAPKPPKAATDAGAKDAPSESGMPAQSTQSTDQEVKEALSQHISQISQPFCPTSPELLASKATYQASQFSLPPPVPFSSPEQAVRQSNPPHEASDDNMAPVQPFAKRSIFSRQEKSSAAKKCAFQSGIMMPGTTVTVPKGGEKIGGIPVGKVVPANAAGSSR
ncbi:hypothetical protein ACHAXT_000599 [Thalassiosira profunda]